jgi:DNA-directed RNA polymerase subunit beta
VKKIFLPMILAEVKLDDLWKMDPSNKSDKEKVDNLKKQYDTARAAIQKVFDNKVNKVQRGDELLPGVMKMVKVFRCG